MLGDACHVSLCLPNPYTGLLNNLKYSRLYIMCIFVQYEAFMSPRPVIDWSPPMEWTPMGKRIRTAEAAAVESSFGERLASLRKSAGFTQVELAAELGVSQRMMAYYESPNATPPAALLPQLATALGISIDELFGRSPKRKLVKQDGDSRLRRRLLAIEKLDVVEKRQVLQLLDAFIERGQLRRKAESRA